jgi:hypothetical protein
MRRMGAAVDISNPAPVTCVALPNWLPGMASTPSLPLGSLPGPAATRLWSKHACPWPLVGVVWCYRTRGAGWRSLVQTLSIRLLCAMYMESIEKHAYRFRPIATNRAAPIDSAEPASTADWLGQCVVIARYKSTLLQFRRK